MDGENQNPNVPNDSPVTSEPTPAPEQPAAPAPEPAAPEPTPAPAPMEEHKPMDDGKKGMSKSLMWGVVALAVLVVVFLLTR